MRDLGVRDVWRDQQPVGEVLLEHVLVPTIYVDPNAPVRDEFPHLLRVRLG